MSQKQIIALDAMGGDFGPRVVVPAANEALQKNETLGFIFFGRQTEIKPLLDKYPKLRAVSSIHHTDDVIANDEKPSVAVRSGRKSSMRLAIDAVKNGEAQSIVSGGNTGALMATAKFVLKCLPGIHRPAIASVFPTKNGDTIMLDLGANLQCTAEMLVQFSYLGAVYAGKVLGIDVPSVGLLNIGEEEMKGHDELREASKLLGDINFPGDFVGFIEGNDIPDGKVDVVVTDGFTGNVALKVAEGVAELSMHSVKQAFKSSFLAKLGAMLAYRSLKAAKKRMDYRVYNGGMFLGLSGICVKSHGSMDIFGYSQAILVAAGLVENGYNEIVAAEIGEIMAQQANSRVLDGSTDTAEQAADAS